MLKKNEEWGLINIISKDMFLNRLAIKCINMHRNSSEKLNSLATSIHKLLSDKGGKQIC